MSLAATEVPPAIGLLRIVQAYFLEHPQAFVLEEGRVIFDMAVAHSSLSAENGRCLLHLWSEEHNIVRTVCGARTRKDSLLIETRRFGQVRSQSLEICTRHDRRAPGTRNAARVKYQRLLERVLMRAFPEWQIGAMRTAADLENSFGPAYTRGVLRRGLNTWAVIAVNGEESQTTVDAILAVGLLWLAYCRERWDGKRVVEGLRVIVPVARFHTVQERMAWLNPAAARYELYELDPLTEELATVDCRKNGNLRLTLMRAYDPRTVLDRSREDLEDVLSHLNPEHREKVEVRANSATEVSLALHGLEFARIRRKAGANTFTSSTEIIFGAGANETLLSEETRELFCDLTWQLFENRRAEGSMRNPLYRLQPERWLESLLRKDIAEIEPSIRPDIVYTQVPAFTSGDRGMLDLLTVNRQGRLVVIEIKADDDLQLPLQALDYWCRVRQLQQEHAFERQGYFRGIELSDQPPLLYLIAPVLRIHPATDTILRYMSTGVEWDLIGLNEDWRLQRKVILRKRSGAIPVDSLTNAHAMRIG